MGVFSAPRKNHQSVFFTETCLNNWVYLVRINEQELMERHLEKQKIGKFFNYANKFNWQDFSTKIYQHLQDRHRSYPSGVFYVYACALIQTIFRIAQSLIIPAPLTRV